MLIDLVRHGETQATGRLIGRADVPLSDAGWQQFERATKDLAYDAVVASPRQRARLPAEALASARNLPLRIDADWAELDFGEWDGCVVAELEADTATAAALAALYRSPDATAAPGGENWRALQTRVRSAMDSLLALHGERSRVLVSTHAGPMRAALAHACAIPFANLWAFRIGFGTRITLRAGCDANSGLWGEVVELVQT